MTKKLTCVNGITGVSCTGFLDYLSFTLPDEIDHTEAVEKLFEIPFDYFSKSPSGRNGYHLRYAYGNINLLTKGGAAGMGHNITLTGKACHQFHERLRFIITLVFEMGGHFTRCDLTIDDFQGLLDMDEILKAITGGRVISRLHKLMDNNSYDKKTGKTIGRGAYFGSRKSDVFIRFYDKALEQETDYHWIRVESELKNGKADTAMKLLLHQEIGEIARGILKDRLSFREPGNGTNRSRWPVSPWWELFLGSVEKLQLVSNKSETPSQEARLTWFLSNSATFAELVDTCGFGVIPMMYESGKKKLCEKESVL